MNGIIGGYEVCDECKGTGQIEGKKCQYCDGTGETTWCDSEW
jgi:DnaJ-class molecular chaperone